MREEHAGQALTVLQHVVEVRVNDVDAQVVLWKRGAAVDDHRAALVLDHEAVHADFPEATQGDESNEVFGARGQNKARGRDDPVECAGKLRV